MRYTQTDLSFLSTGATGERGITPAPSFSVKLVFKQFENFSALTFGQTVFAKVIWVP